MADERKAVKQIVIEVTENGAITLRTENVVIFETLGMLEEAKRIFVGDMERREAGQRMREAQGRLEVAAVQSALTGGKPGDKPPLTVVPS